MITIVKQHEKRPRELMAVGLLSLEGAGGFVYGVKGIVDALNLDYLWEGNDDWEQDEEKFIRMAGHQLNAPYSHCVTPHKTPLSEYRYTLKFKESAFTTSSRGLLIELVRGLHIQQLMLKKQNLTEAVLVRDSYDQMIYEHPVVEKLYQDLNACIVWWP